MRRSPTSSDRASDRASDPASAPASDPPSAPGPDPAGAAPGADDTRTSIIRRAPAAPPPPADDTATGLISPAGPAGPNPPAGPAGPAGDESATGLLPRAKPTRVPGTGPRPQRSSRTAVAACVVAMLSGWATSVIATDLITGWWNTDRLFCLAVGFLALVFAVATMAGIVLVLLRRPLGRWLIAVGAVVALLAYGGVFIAGARLPWIVYLLPVLPVASAGLALHPSTRRWTS
ncbi:hypothetical protein [Mycolicibacterium palauense]|uniref:hypothetical protein n=1 Tax=Mycolicibacterium palauense TaxID=2034511 RepID=UPI000BFEE6DC|nr:hypothetical protein [Mycolicibacterium palauense]